MLLSSDRLRKEGAGRDPLSPAAAGWQHGLYSPERTRRTYDLLLRRVGTLLANGESVILDASWQDEAERAAARKMAADSAGSLVELCCQAPETVAWRRIRQRAGDPSDATAEVAARMARRFAPWPQARIVDTTTPPADTVRRARHLVEGGQPCMS